MTDVTRYLMDTLNERFAEQETGELVLVRDESGDWTCAMHYGREAPDSPMVGASAFGFGCDAEVALRQAMTEAGWLDG